MPLFVEYEDRTRTIYPGDEPYLITGARGSTYLIDCRTDDQSSKVFLGRTGVVSALKSLKHLERMGLKALTGRVRLTHVAMGTMECPVCINKVPVALATKHVGAHLGTNIRLLPKVSETTKAFASEAVTKLLAHAHDHPIIGAQGAEALQVMDRNGLY